MGKLLKNWSVLMTVLVVLSATFLKVTDARAKASLWDDDEEDEDDDFWGKSEEKEAAPSAQVGKSVVAAAAVDPHANHPHHINNEPRQNFGGGDGGISSGNFAAHNESCSPAGKSCVPNAKLECSTTDGAGRCACITGWVYVRATESCWKIAKSTQDTCAHDVQCQAGSFGQQSRCDKITARCECVDWISRREMILVEGVCYVKKSVGDLCDSHEECDRPIAGDAYCQYGDYGSVGGHKYNGSCQCRESHSWYKPLSSCLAKSTQLGDPCVISQQCREGTLGPLSKCNADTVKCECWAYAGVENKTEVVYYEKLKKCFLKKEYNDTCNEVEECRASLGPDVECAPTDEFPDQNVCHCPKGKTCRSSGLSIIQRGVSMSTVGLTCAAAVVGIAISLNGGVMQ